VSCGILWISAAERRQSLATALRPCCSNDVKTIPRLSKAGMPSRSESWGGLVKGEQYRLIRSASRVFIRSLRSFEQTTPPLRGSPPY
jgi:hypothetical protein